MFTKCVENSIDYPSQSNYCFSPDIKAECKALTKRLCKFQPKRRRIYQLAIPRNKTCKYEAMCARLFRRPIEIIRLYDRMQPTRIKMLAYATVRRLLSVIEDKKCLLDPQRLQILYFWVRKSLLSLYSRLYNVELPEIPKKPEKWTPKEWRRHLRYISHLSRPRRPIRHPEIPRNQWKLDAFVRTFNVLSVPRVMPEQPSPEWELVKIKGYKPSQRIIDLAVANSPVGYVGNIKVLPIPVSESAKKYKASPRIKELSAPQVKTKLLILSDIKENPFTVAPNALKARASDRTKQLAEPKEVEEPPAKNTFAVSPAALKAKASPRTIELAKHKVQK